MGLLDPPSTDYRGKVLSKFDPLRDLPVVASYDASLLTAANGAALSVWPDSGSYKLDLTQPTTANQPTVVTNAQNGLRAVRLGATSYLSNQFFGNQWDQPVGYPQPLTIAACLKVSSSGSRAAAGAVTGWLSPASTNRLSLQVDTSGAWSLFGSAAGAVGGDPANDDTPRIVFAYFGADGSTIWDNGFLSKQLNTQAHGTTALKGFAIGAACDGTAPLGLADIYQVQVINGRLSRDQVDRYTQHLATKWGIS